MSKNLIGAYTLDSIVATTSVNLPFLANGTSNQILGIDSNGLVKVITIGSGSGTVISVGATITAGALSVSGSPITTSGNFAFTWTGSTSQYVRGDGTLASFPSIPSGTVTSVGISVPSWLTVSGSPVTNSGTIAISATTGQVANRFLATPNGSTGVVSLRAIVASDLPNLSGLNGSLNISQINATGTPSITTYLRGDGTWSTIPSVVTYTADESTLHLASTVFSIKSTYIGQTSITTLGTITAGTWNGAVIGTSYLPATVILSSGSYSDPTWLSTLAWNKITGITGTPNGTKFLRDDGSWQTVTGGGSGTVTSVGLTTPSWLTVSGSPVTTIGTLAVSATTGQTANNFLATPNGSTGAVGLRAIVAADIPNLTESQITGLVSDLSGKAPASGSANYVQNGTSTQSSTSFNIDGTGTAGAKIIVGQDGGVTGGPDYLIVGKYNPIDNASILINPWNSGYALRIRYSAGAYGDATYDAIGTGNTTTNLQHYKWNFNGTNVVDLSSDGAFKIVGLASAQKRMALTLASGVLTNLPNGNDGDIIAMLSGSVAWRSPRTQILYSGFTDVGNVGGGEDDLMTYTVPAGQLANNGDFIDVYMFFVAAVNGNSKVIIPYVGTNNITSITMTSASGGLTYNMKITRVDSTHVRVTFDYLGTNVTGFTFYLDAGLTTSSTFVIKATGTAVADNDLIQKSMTVIYHSAS